MLLYFSCSCTSLVREVPVCGDFEQIPSEAFFAKRSKEGCVSIHTYALVDCTQVQTPARSGAFLLILRTPSLKSRTQEALLILSNPSYVCRERNFASSSLPYLEHFFIHTQEPYHLTLHLEANVDSFWLQVQSIIKQFTDHIFKWNFTIIKATKYNIKSQTTFFRSR